MPVIDMLPIQKQIESNTWVFAKTMPHIPHFYVVKNNWVMGSDGMTFEDIVRFIRGNGRMMKWGSKVAKPYLFLNGWKYWTMGDPVEETIILNRERARYETPYDAMASRYDSEYETSAHLLENKCAFKAASPSGRVLDIGCGTGLAIDYIETSPDDYVGIDPSFKMLREFAQNHTGYPRSLTCSTFQDYFGEGFDSIIAMFGAGSYLQERDFDRINSMLNSGGRAFIMSYADGYTPDLYKENHVPTDGLVRPIGGNPMFGKYAVREWVKP